MHNERRKFHSFIKRRSLQSKIVFAHFVIALSRCLHGTTGAISLSFYCGRARMSPPADLDRVASVQYM